MILVDEKLSSSPKTFVTSFNAASTAPTSPVKITVPLNLSTKPKSTSADFVATSAAIIDASLGVIVSIPMAPFFL